MKPVKLKVTGSYARTLLICHSIFSVEKKTFIREKAQELDLCGICKHGFPLGIIAVEGKQERVNNYVKQIKTLRWSSCTLTNFTSGLSESDLRMTADRRVASQSAGVEMVEKLSEVGAYMRRVGLEDWWRKCMGYDKSHRRSTTHTRCRQGVITENAIHAGKRSPSQQAESVPRRGLAQTPFSGG